MNSDLYYIKYLKYKTKYLDEKKKIGGWPFTKSCGNEFEKIDELRVVDFIAAIFNLLKKNKITKDEIIKQIKDMYDYIVLPVKKLNKDCLKPELTKYLSSKEVQNVLQSFNLFSFFGGDYTSLNIVENDDKTFRNEIGFTGKFSKGTAFLLDGLNFTNRNSRYLTNLIQIQYKWNPYNSYNYIESMRFGTPYAPKGNINFYKNQIEILKNFIGEKKCLFISLLDLCDSSLCIEWLVGEKVNENEIIHNEIKGYSVENIVYLNMACNNSVNLTKNLSAVSDKELIKKLVAYLDKLETWLEDDVILQNLRDNGNFFEKFKKNVLENDGSDKDLLTQLSIKKFVLKEKFKEKDIIDIGDLKNFIDNDMTQFSPCEEDLTNENIRLVMFCYISLIFYILSINYPGRYILLYHCKSGQDRTGTFYAINQMVNEITKDKYDEIINEIEEGKSFIDIFKTYYSLTKQYEEYKTTEKICPPNPKDVLEKEEENINKTVELCYLKYLLFSYNITTTSTGCPGLKWGLANKQFFLQSFDKRTYKTGSAIDNRFPYLLLGNPYYARLFHGASEQRGS